MYSWVSTPSRLYNGYAQQALPHHNLAGLVFFAEFSNLTRVVKLRSYLCQHNYKTSILWGLDIKSDVRNAGMNSTNLPESDFRVLFLRGQQLLLLRHFHVLNAIMSSIHQQRISKNVWNLIIIGTSHVHIQPVHIVS